MCKHDLLFVVIVMDSIEQYILRELAENVDWWNIVSPFFYWWFLLKKIKLWWLRLHGWKYGWKVLTVSRRGNIRVYSSCASNMAQSYFHEKIVRRKHRCGPLAVFKRSEITNAIGFLAFMQHLNTGTYVMQKCIYKPSKDKQYWFEKTSAIKIFNCRKYAATIPEGKDFADAVIILSE